MLSGLLVRKLGTERCRPTGGVRLSPLSQRNITKQSLTVVRPSSPCPLSTPRLLATITLYQTNVLYPLAPTERPMKVEIVFDPAKISLSQRVAPAPVQAAKPARGGAA